MTRDEPQHFAERRSQVETNARRRVSHGEVTLAEIYEILGRELNWQPGQTARAMQVELDAESNALVAVPGMAAVVAEARRVAGRVLFLTDMYLPSDFIESILRREGFFQDGDRLLVSGELKKNKHGGEMFAEVKKLHPDIGHWKHTGDNVHSDLHMAQPFGIAAMLETRCHLTRHEKLARGTETFAPLWRSQLAGAMRLARLENPETDGQRRAIWDASCDVVGPLLFGFVHWCLATAQARGLRRLYFVARDGQIMHRIAQVIAKNWSYEVECCYLYGSRQAWHPAAIDRFTRDDFSRFFVPGEFLSLSQVFKRLGLKLEHFQPQLQRHGLAGVDGKTKLAAAARRQLEELLLDAEMAAAVEGTARARRELLLAYLKQERFFDGTPFAVVDIGWFGNLQKSLTRVLHLSGTGGVLPLTGFYFGLLSRPDEASAGSSSGYWNTFATRHDALRQQNLALFELFTAADHGSVTGFAKNGDQIVPELAAENNTRALEWGLTAMQSGVVRFAELFSRNAERDGFTPAEFFPVTRRLLDEFYLRPSATEASVWGKFQYSDGQTEAAFEQMVPDWNNRQIIAALLDRKKRPVYWWHEGTLAVCPCLPLSLFTLIRRFKRRWC